MADTSVKVGEGGKKSKRPKWQFALLFVGVLVLAVAAGAGLRWLQQYREYKLATKPDAIETKAEDAQNIALSGDYDKAHEQLDEALDNPQLSADGKYTLLMQRGITYENQQKYDDAIKTYQEAEAIKATQAIAEAIARAAEAKGDKQLAIEYYKKAISRIDKETNPRAESEQSYYEKQIENLGGQV